MIPPRQSRKRYNYGVACDGVKVKIPKIFLFCVKKPDFFDTFLFLCFLLFFWDFNWEPFNFYKLYQQKILSLRKNKSTLC